MQKVVISNYKNNENIIFNSNKYFKKEENYIFKHDFLDFEKVFKIKNIFNKIAIIGMPLAGKTTFVKDIKGIDLDEEIEKYTNEKIISLINKNKFRLIETEVLKKLVIENNNIISLGGGVILKKENIILLKDYLIIFLNISLRTLLKRYKKNIRPLIKSKQDLINLYKERIDKYFIYSDLIIEEDNLLVFKRYFKNKLIKYDLPQKTPASNVNNR